jgi:aconitate hydratase
MAFDLDTIKRVYAELPEKISAARKVVGRPMTFTDKVLYAHLANDLPSKPYERGKSYVNFNPDRVAMQDATAQMALLQFMQAGRPTTAVPTTVHCDHLIQAEVGAAQDLAKAARVNKEELRVPRRHDDRNGLAHRERRRAGHGGDRRRRR